MDEYWEVDGRMLCERHAGSGSRGGSDEEGSQERRNGKSTRAMKRVTRYIDLAGAGVGIGGGGRSGRDSIQDSDLR